MPQAHERERRRREAHTGGPGVLPRKILKKWCNLVHSGDFWGFFMGVVSGLGRILTRSCNHDPRSCSFFFDHRERRRHEALTGGPGVLPRKILKKWCNLVHFGAFGEVIHRISRYLFFSNNSAVLLYIF